MNPKSWGKEYGEPWDWSSRPKYEPETFGSIGSCYTTIDIEIHGCKRIPELLIWYSCEDVLSRHIMSHPYKLLQSPKLFDLYTSGNPPWRSIDHKKKHGNSFGEIRRSLTNGSLKSTYQTLGRLPKIWYLEISQTNSKTWTFEKTDFVVCRTTILSISLLWTYMPGVRQHDWGQSSERPSCQGGFSPEIC
jgi:hypothetical protein